MNFWHRMSIVGRFYLITSLLLVVIAATGGIAYWQSKKLTHQLDYIGKTSMEELVRLSEIEKELVELESDIAHFNGDTWKEITPHVIGHVRFAKKEIAELNELHSESDFDWVIPESFEADFENLTTLMDSHEELNANYRKLLQNYRLVSSQVKRFIYTVSAVENDMSSAMIAENLGGRLDSLIFSTDKALDSNNLDEVTHLLTKSQSLRGDIESMLQH